MILPQKCISRKIEFIDDTGWAKINNTALEKKLGPIFRFTYVNTLFPQGASTLLVEVYVLFKIRFA